MTRNWMHDIGLRVIKLINILLIACPFLLCWHFYYAARAEALPAQNAMLYFLLPVLFVALYVTLARIYNAFLVSYYRVSEMVYSQMLAACIADGLVYIVICIFCKKLQPLWLGAAAIAGQFVLSTLWSVCSRKWYFRHFPPKKTYVIYDTRFGIDARLKDYGLSRKYAVEKVIPVADVLRDLSMLNEVQEVFLSGIHSHDRNIIAKYCIDRGIEALVLPRLGDAIMLGAKKMHIMHLPVLRVQRYNPKPEYLLAKRIFDLIFSVLALVVLSPVFLVTAICIKKDGGPVFYRQERLTKDGKVFKLIKFRSMRVDAEKDGIARLSTGENDDRITPVGKVIRRLRIDELPQIFNILQGNLSLVGPRPERPSIARQYEEEMPEFRLRLQCKAGLTGYAQVYGKYNTTPYDKLMMDMMYIANPGILQDLRIVFATVKILFMSESTEGVKDGQITAMDREDRENAGENADRTGEEKDDLKQDSTVA